MRLSSTSLAVLLAACGPGTAATSDTAPGSTSGTDTAPTTAPTTDSSTDPETDSTPTTDPTTGETATTGPTVDPCDCPDPKIVDGDIDAAALPGLAGTCIVEVSGNVSLSGIEDPTLLEPLSGLKRADQVSLFDSPGVVDLSTFGCLEETRRIFLADNPALVDISALTRVRIAPELLFVRSPIAAMPSFAPDYQGLSSLVLFDLHELVDLDPLAGWPGILDEFNGMQVAIGGADSLQSVAGLTGILGVSATPDAEVTVDLTDLPALTSVGGLENLSRATLTLGHLPKVTSLAPLAAFERSDILELFGMPGLGSLQGLENLQSADFLRLGGCVDGDELGITDLGGLASLAAVEARLSIVGNPKLAALTGAPLLKHVGQLELVINPKLGADAVAAFEAQVKPSSQCFGGWVECGCLGEVPAGLREGCPAQWSGGSAVDVKAPGGPIDGTTAFFGYVTAGSYFNRLALVVLDTDSDIADAKGDGLFGGSGGAPKLIAETDAEYPQWIGEHVADGLLTQPGGEEDNVTVSFVTTARLGDWMTPDPADPPRLVGEFLLEDPNAATTVQGPFDAVFCESFIRFLSD